MTEKKEILHVAVGIIPDAAGRVLLARRPEHVHQGNLWEFPGGKIEAAESVFTALQRELHEELGIEVMAGRPLIAVRHDYPDRQVLLDVWLINHYRGLPAGREGQVVCWVDRRHLTDHAFPAANRTIVTAARLPECYLITPEPGDVEVFLHQLSKCIRHHGIKLVQLRTKSRSSSTLRLLAQQALAICHRQGAQLLINGGPEILADIDADGVHLSSETLFKFSQRPCGTDRWLAASCHNLQELQQAHRIGVDFVVVSPVLATASHPGVTPLGWPVFEALAEQSILPVYALGGMTRGLLPQAWRHGGQGIAAISAFWKV